MRGGVGKELGEWMIAPKGKGLAVWSEAVPAQLNSTLLSQR